jgi:hypothetical protein
MGHWLAGKAAPARQVAGRSRIMFNALAELWCRTMHDGVTWPVRGRYHCRRCGRTYQVPFQERSIAGKAVRRAKA